MLVCGKFNRCGRRGKEEGLGWGRSWGAEHSLSRGLLYPSGSSTAQRTFRVAAVEVGQPVLEAPRGPDVGCGLPQEGVSVPREGSSFRPR